MLVKNTPVKSTPSKDDSMPSKKVLTPHHTIELPVKKQQNSSPSSKRESETDHRKDGKSKQKKKKAKSNPIMASDLEVEMEKEQMPTGEEVGLRDGAAVVVS